MNYSETIEYLYSCLPVYHRIGKAAYKADLENTIALDKYFGSPHRNFRSIHIAGTNGKGSVSHMLASVLQESGLKTGLYTSPHLRDFRERIRINGAMITEEEVISFVAGNRSILEEIKPSFFEMSVAMAFDYFARKNADIVVVETGLGGRLDSTNIIRPVLSVITNIGFDHMDLLGDTLEKIAGEKAGIIKDGVPVIIGESGAETDGVFELKALQSNSPLYFAENSFKMEFDHLEYSGEKRPYIVTELATGIRYSGLAGLTGDYQVKNIPVVWQAFNLLKDTLGLKKEALEAGIRNVVENTGLHGRWQVIGVDPLIICDTGHNVHGLRWVMRQLAEYEPEKIHFVIGFVNDKDLGLVLPLFPKVSKYYFTKASVPRALDQELLKTRAGEYGLAGQSYGTVSKALRAAKEHASPGDMIFVGGSTFVVGEVV